MKTKIQEQLEAVKLRNEGKSINEIASTLNVSKSSISIWVREIDVPYKFTKECREQLKKEKEQQLIEARNYRISIKPEKILSGSGRWLIRTPKGYEGKTYIKGLYIYEHRYIMEQKLGRLLGINEVVHHKDGNKLNNDVNNLELKTRKEHTSYHSPKPKTIKLKCSFCNNEFEIRTKLYKSKKKIGQENFFCCRSHQVSHQQKNRCSLKIIDM